jgi:soluble lytic murein transglycosylase
MQAQKQVEDAILRESEKNHLDPVLVVAVIEHESQFRPHKRGTHGEIGLMQIKPKTGKWIAKRNGIPWTSDAALEDPSYNIKVGTAYLGMLKSRFHQQKLYLAAYNMGPTRVKQLVRRSEVPHRYSRQVLKQYHRLYAMN